MKGLAYVDFLDDEHLVAAVAKNKNTLLGKKLSIARSDPKRGGKETFDPKNTEHGKSTFFFFFFTLDKHLQEYTFEFRGKDLKLFLKDLRN